MEDKERQQVLDAFWNWARGEGIGEDPADYMPWLECFVAGYKEGVK